MEDEINLLDYWRILWRGKWLITVVCFLAVLAALLVSINLPETFRATATILPPAAEPASLGQEMLRQAGLGRLGPRATPVDLFVGMLKSRRMLDAAADHFDLAAVYEAETRQDTRERLDKRTSISVSREQLINVSVIDHCPERAAAIANFYVGYLDTLNREINITQAGQMRRFVEEQLVQARRSLREAEAALEAYQVEHKVLGARREGADGAGGLAGRLIARRIELEAKSRYTTDSHPEIIRLRHEISEMERAIAALPPVESELARLVRELKTQETVYQLLVSQHEQARIDEARDMPTVQVLDHAIPPERKHGPKVMLAMAVSGFAALLSAVIFLFSFAYARNQRVPAK